jgi:hypothetical protein
VTRDNISEHEWLFPEGFTGFRTGLREHIDTQRFVGYDAGIYLYLHMHARWTAGICYTCAPVIKDKLGIPLSSVQDSLYRMRDRKYINYPKGDGRRTSYAVLIHKARPTVGMLFCTYPDPIPRNSSSFRLSV